MYLISSNFKVYLVYFITPVRFRAAYIYIRSIIVYVLFSTVYLCKKSLSERQLTSCVSFKYYSHFVNNFVFPSLIYVKKMHCKVVKCKALIICSINGYGWDLNEFSVTAGNKSLQLNSIDETFTTFIASLWH